MKRTDEMKLGEQLNRFCDCNQGRRDCTCRGVAELVKNHQRVGRIQRKIGMPPEMAAPYGTQPNPIERFSGAAQLQLMKALAILGWAAFFLELLRV